MESLPAGSDEVINVAVPPLRLTVPMAVPPSSNVTVPVGMPAAGDTGLTVAVKVTCCPYVEGLAEEVTVVVVLA